MQDSSQPDSTLREGVRLAYSAAARSPEDKHPFPVGRAFAESVGYPASLLDELPDGAADAFSGVSNIGVTAPVERDMRVLDLGCGAGLDCLVVQSRMRDGIRVFGVDFSEEMLRRAQDVAVVLAAAESLPIAAHSVDLALVNGIFNLNPFRAGIYRELARIVKPGGRVYGAELILRESLPASDSGGTANWFS